MRWFFISTFILGILALTYYLHWQRRDKSPRVSRDLPGSRLKLDNLSKEVELDWEASDMIRIEPGAWARHKDAMPDHDDKTRERHEERYQLPKAYGNDRLVLMARDPSWIYAYWDVACERRQELYQKHLREWHMSRPVLRLYSTLGCQKTQVDVPINDDADNWYVEISSPNSLVVAELGRVFPSGFHPLLRSNEVLLPAKTISNVICEEWAPLPWHDRYKKGYEPQDATSPWIWGGKDC